MPELAIDLHSEIYCLFAGGGGGGGGGGLILKAIKSARYMYLMVTCAKLC